MEPTTALLIAGVLAISAALAVVFWNHILKWAEEALFPWVDKNLPSLSGLVRDAFVVLDNAVVRVRLAAKAAWAKVRKFLLKELIEFEKRANGEFVRVVTIWAIKQLEDEEDEQIKKVVTEETIPRDKIPDDIREEFLRRGRKKSKALNVTKVRDREIAEMSLAT